MACNVREMVEGDIAQVARVERSAFPTQWPGTPFRRELQNRLARYLVAVESAPGSSPPAAKPAPPANGNGSSDDQPFLTRWISGIKHVFSPPQPDADPSPDHVLGFVGIWFMVDEAHITSIGVLDTHRRKGIGEALLISSIDLAVRRGSRIMTLEVRVSNDSAQALYEKYVFGKVGIRKGYYTDNHEDAYIMSTDVITSAAYQTRFQQLKEAHKARWGDSLKVLV